MRFAKGVRCRCWRGIVSGFTDLFSELRILLCLVAGEALDEGVQASFNRLSVTFQGRLPPTVDPVLVDDLYEKPPWKDAKVLDGLDFGHAYEIK